MPRVKKAKVQLDAAEVASINHVDAVFVIDATGSMAPYIDEAKYRAQAKATSIGAEAGLNIAFAVAIYRDHPPQDSLPAQAWGFDKGLSPLQAVTATGGGDRPESVWDGVQAAIDLPWRDGSDRRLFLIGDSPPHGHQGNTVLQNGVGWRDGSYDGFPQGCPCGLTADKLIARLKEKHITVHGHSIAGHSDTTAAFELLAKATGGEVTTVQHSFESTRTMGSTFTVVGSSVTDARNYSSTADTMPGASYSEVTASMGWDAARSAANASYLNSRGIEVTGPEDKTWAEINKNLKKAKAKK